MVISIEQAVALLSQGRYIMIETTDHRLALVPSYLGQTQIHSSDAINSMYYIVKGESTQKVRSMIKQMGRYREIRGAC